MSVTVRGIGDAVAKLRQIGAEGERIASTEIVAAALNIQTGSKQITPVDTGRLRNSIAVAEQAQSLAGDDEGGPVPNGIRDGMLTAVIGTNVTYAPDVHYGTTRMPGRPFLTTPFEQEKPKLLARLQSELKKLEAM